MASLKYRKKYGELEIKCDCGRLHTVTQSKEGEEVVFQMETDETNISTDHGKEILKNADANDNGKGSDPLDKHAKKKGLLDFEL